MNTPRCDYTVILNQDTQILLQRTDDGWQLPRFTNSEHFWQSVEMVNEAVSEDLDLGVLTIKCLLTEYDETSNIVKNVYLQRYLSGTISDDLQWFALDALPREIHAIIAEEIHNWLNTQKPVWYSLDWIDELQTELAPYTPQKLTQLRSWERSTVWRVETVEVEDALYYKAVPDMFRHEAALTRWLYAKYPQNFPRIVDDVLFLMQDLQAQDLTHHKSVDVWANAMAIWAKIQLQLISQIDDLIDLGVPQRSLDWLKSRIEVVLMRDETYAIGDYKLSDDEQRKLCDSIPQLMNDIDKIVSLGIPMTLEHGDLWAGQIMVGQDDSFIFTDWSDATLTHPFFSLEFFTVMLSDDFPDAPETRERVIIAYLQAWQEYASLDACLDTFESVKRISPLFSAIRYHDDILPHMGAKWEMHNMLPFYLKNVVKAL